MLTNVRYMARLIVGLGWNRIELPGRRVGGVIAVVLLAAIAAAGFSYGNERATGWPAAMDGIESRIDHLAELFDQVEAHYEHDVAPIERVLLGYRSDDPQLARRVAVALVREARRTQLEPRLLLAVLLVENPWIDPSATSHVGAQGLMQVMPFHRGQWKPCAPRLDDVDANICHGASIFAWNLKAANGNVDKALLRYNGCVKGTNTPDCHQYPNHVYARAGRASILAWRSSVGTLGASR